MKDLMHKFLIKESIGYISSKKHFKSCVETHLKLHTKYKEVISMQEIIPLLIELGLIIWEIIKALLNYF
jgi:hypothetical protein